MQIIINIGSCVSFANRIIVILITQTLRKSSMLLIDDGFVVSMLDHYPQSDTIMIRVESYCTMRKLETND